MSIAQTYPNYYVSDTFLSQDFWGVVGEVGSAGGGDDDPPKKSTYKRKNWFERNSLYGESHGSLGDYHKTTKKDVINAGIVLGGVTGGMFLIAATPAIIAGYGTVQYTYSLLNVSEAVGIVIGAQVGGGVIDGSVKYYYDVNPDAPYIFPNSPVFRNSSKFMNLWWLYQNK